MYLQLWCNSRISRLFVRLLFAPLKASLSRAFKGGGGVEVLTRKELSWSLVFIHSSTTLFLNVGRLLLRGFQMSRSRRRHPRLFRQLGREQRWRPATFANPIGIFLSVMVGA